jgi:hypothetical protein
MTSDPSWLLLIHQIPQTPGYLRVKIWRRLQRVGAVAIKNSVYVLPANEQSREDFEWTLNEIVQGGGDATICEARFVEGLSLEQVEALFHAARDADYEQIAEEARELSSASPVPSATDIARLRRRLEDNSSIDFFGAPGKVLAEAALLSAESRIRSAGQSEAEVTEKTDFRSRTWVTRKGIHVDRIASSWLIRKFIDPEARFKYVAGQDYCPEARELRFDMFQAEFTHEGEDCTFEVLKRRFALEEAALDSIAEIVHDIDLKDGKFARPEAPGVAAILAGICRVCGSDEERLGRGEQLFDHLQAWFKNAQPGVKGE